MSQSTRKTEAGKDAAGREPAALRTFPMPRSCPMSPPDSYAELREHEPVSRAALQVNGKPAWLITRFADLKQILGDSRVSANLKLPGYPLQVPVPDEVLQAVPLTFLSMDSPEHTVHRRMLAPEFSVRRIRALRENVEQIVDHRINDLLAGSEPTDLVAALAMPVPALVICELLGVPYADHEQFEIWSAQTMSRDIDDAARGLAHQHLDTYVDNLVTAKETEPGDDMISRLIAKNREEPTVSHADIASMSRLMLIAGHETTANMISLGVLTFLRHPELLASITAEPDLLPAAVEELLRHFSISDSGTARVAMADIEIGDVTIKAGEGILPLNNAANHDPDVFTDPDRIDFHRAGRAHLAFGYGIHQCIGQNLARIELEIVYRRLFERIPSLRLAVPFEELRFKHDAMVYGLHALPVTW
ncbi:cytochrome P450 [Nocardia sp. NPDC051570]|uniref:cytochrome P450 n=1 Tax=Nocardia sp. NPDC051570 TaxID=3364324 RepID=UPI00378C601C